MTGNGLTLAHQALLSPLLAARWGADVAPEHTLAEPWFANLYLFRAAHGWRWQPGDWPCISGRAYDGTRLLLPLFDLRAAPLDAMRRLLEGHDAFGPLAAAQTQRMEPTCWSVGSHRDDADYVYTAQQFRHYRGRLLQKKRNLTKQLLEHHAVEAVPYAPAWKAEAEGVLCGWMDDKSRRPGEADDGPCREALALADVLKLDGTLYRIDGRAVGFVVAETLRPGVAAMRFAKGLAAYKGLYPHMFQQFCQSRPGLQWLNFEQDLGSANFRQTKMSYQPFALIDRFRARPLA